MRNVCVLQTKCVSKKSQSRTYSRADLKGAIDSAKKMIGIIYNVRCIHGIIHNYGVFIFLIFIIG